MPGSWRGLLTTGVAVGLAAAAFALASLAPAPLGAESRPLPSSPALDPAARLLEDGDASETWALYLELDSGHRITQRFLVTNAGPGSHNAVAIGHLIEPGRAPYRYENGRMRSRWTLSDDRLFFDIAASHLDLHRPRGELRISKQDVQIQLFFDFEADAPAARVPSEVLPDDYHVELLAIGAATRGTIRGPWMSEDLEVRGRAWLVHTWTSKSESDLLRRRLEVFAADDETAFYGLAIDPGKGFGRGWQLARAHRGSIIESEINVPARWSEARMADRLQRSRDYPLPGDVEILGAQLSGRITLAHEWLRFDPLAVIPQPFRWFIRRGSQPQEVWADVHIEGTLPSAPEPPSLPTAGAHERDVSSSSERENEDEIAKRSLTGVASITFMNPMGRR